MRAMLRRMAPVKSIPLIQSFLLPAEEEMVLIEREARGKSLQQIAFEHNMTVETVKRRRRCALEKIANSL